MLIPCERCKRHISTRETDCPFCRHRSAFARLGAAALSAGVLLAGCDAGKGAKAGSGSAAESRPYATLSGRITDKTGTRLVGASVFLIREGAVDGTDYQKTAHTDETGHYKLDLIEPGSYRVVYQTDGRMRGSESRPMTLHGGDDEIVDITLDLRDMGDAKPYGAPPARRRVV